jgi:flavin reductase (DIM6/NTAB) family NADH-FMN oxidoreductase RutF
MSIVTPQAFDSLFFRKALSQFTTGITVITTVTPDGTPIGLTANSFNAVSLDPPLVLWSLALKARSLQPFQECKHYAINVLAFDQKELSSRFGKSTTGADGNKFEGVTYRRGLGGVPLLEGCCAWFECANRSRYEEGDHVIFVGHVARCAAESKLPLAFQGGQYCLTKELVTESA